MNLKKHFKNTRIYRRIFNGRALENVEKKYRIIRDASEVRR